MVAEDSSRASATSCGGEKSSGAALWVASPGCLLLLLTGSGWSAATRIAHIPSTGALFGGGFWWGAVNSRFEKCAGDDTSCGSFLAGRCLRRAGAEHALAPETGQLRGPRHAAKQGELIVCRGSFQTKKDLKMANLLGVHPKTYGKGAHKCRVTGNTHGLIRKYGINMDRQSFRERALAIGFKKY